MTEFHRFIRFGITGTVGFLVDVGVLYLGLHAGLGYFYGRAISFLCAVVVTWQLNRRFTFLPVRQATASVQATRYLAAMCLGGIVNYVTYTTIVLFAPKITYLPFFAVAAGSVAGMFLNFYTAKRWVF